MKFNLIMGLLLGVAFTVVFYSTMPIRWDYNSYWKKIDKNDGKIVIVIGSDPTCKNISHSYCSLGGPHEDGRWEEFLVVSFRDRVEALKVRNELLKVINNENRRIDGER